MDCHCSSEFFRSSWINPLTGKKISSINCGAKELQFSLFILIMKPHLKLRENMVLNDFWIKVFQGCDSPVKIFH